IQPIKYYDENKNIIYIGGAQALNFYLSKEIDELKKKDIPYFIFDCGDFFQGTPEGILSNGKIMVDLMNYLKYDLLSIGNHEFDLGIDNLNELINYAKFDFLCANLINKDKKINLKTKPKKTLIKKGIKINIIGIITNELFKVTGGELENYFELKDIKETIEKNKDLKADLNIILGHIEPEQLNNILNNVWGIDIAFCGHNHISIDTPILVSNTRTIICESGSKLQNLGKLTVYFDKEKKRIIYYENKLIQLKYDTEIIKKDEKLEKVLEPYVKEINQKMEEIIGECDTDLIIDKSSEFSLLGQFLTDILREECKVDIAIYNRTGIRANLLKGEIKVRDIYSIEPFGNTVYIVSLTGKELNEMLKYAFSNSYTYLALSGIEFYFSPSSNELIKKILINGEEIKFDKIYKIAAPSFIALGGDGHFVFKECKEKYDTGNLIRDIYINYIKKKKLIKLETKKNIFIE
ncbi:MAG TPA: 5'-nucleotidase C-terminal domain-containing protein, partial [bacterium]|nr:5'-nucleotidase C-terminal domain-containing protein [bacterium]